MAFFLLILTPLLAIAVSDYRKGVRPFNRLYRRRK